MLPVDGVGGARVKGVVYDRSQCFLSMPLHQQSHRRVVKNENWNTTRHRRTICKLGDGDTAAQLFVSFIYFCNMNFRTSTYSSPLVRN